MSVKVMVICALFANIQIVQTGKSGISSYNGGLTDLVIAIDDNIQENYTLIDTLKLYFQEGSRALYEATGQRAFFQSVTIVIPSFWSPPPNVPIDTTKHTDVFISEPNPLYRNRPYVKQLGGCGKPGEYIHLTPAFLLDESKYGPVGKTIAHEFAHYKWGVFDEYPRKLTKGNHYIDSSGKVRPALCSQSIAGKWVVPGSRDGQSECDPTDSSKLCVFWPDNQAVPSASVMGYSFLKNVTRFCSSDTNDDALKHDSLAPTPQNKMCDGRAVMDVIMDEHPKDLAESALEHKLDELPKVKFNIQQSTSKTKYIFVIEPLLHEWAGRISGILKSESAKLRKVQARFLTKSIATFLRNAPSATTEVAIWSLQYNSTTVELNFTSLIRNNAALIRKSVQKAFNSHWSDIGRMESHCEATVQAMTNAVENHPGSIVYLYTYAGSDRVIRRDKCADYNNSFPDIPITVHFMDLHPIPVNRRNEFYYTLVRFVDHSGGTIKDAFTSVPNLKHVNQRASFGSANKDKSIQVMRKLFRQQTKILGTFLVEEGLQNDLKLYFEHTSKSDLNITITDPDGTKVADVEEQIEDIGDDDVFLWNIMFPENPKAGRWGYSIQVNVNQPTDLDVSVSAQPSENYEPITVTSSINAEKLDFSGDIKDNILIITAEVVKGFLPVFGATVKTIVGKSGYSQEITMKDDGIGADSIANDGVYSAYCTEFSGDGSTEISVKVDTSESDATVGGSVVNGVIDQEKLDEEPEQSMEQQKVDDFERYSSAGIVEVINLPENGTDIYPPARVVDLLVTKIDHTNRVATMQFTATGDDLLTYPASRYEVRYASSSSELRQDFDSTVEVLTEHYRKPNRKDPTPSQPRQIEQLEIHIPASFPQQFSYAIALVVYDDVQHRSEVSNVASFSFIDQGQPIISTPEEISPTSGTTLSTTAGPDDSGDNLLMTNTTMIIAISASILALLVVIIAVAVCCFCGRCCREPNDEGSIHVHFDGGSTISYPPSYPGNEDPYTPGRGMRSTVRREMEEIQNLPTAPAPPPPPPRKRLMRMTWDEFKGTVRDAGKSVRNARDRMKSKFYRGHISYRDHSGVQRANITVHIENDPYPGVVAPPYPGDNQNISAFDPEKSQKGNFNPKASGKYAPSIVSGGSESPVVTPNETPWNKKSGKYTPSIQPVTEYDSLPRHTASPSIPLHELFSSNQPYSYDEATSGGVINPAFLSETADRPSRTTSGSSGEIYSRVPNLEIERIPSVASNDSYDYTDASSPTHNLPPRRPKSIYPAAMCQQVVEDAFGDALEGEQIPDLDIRRKSGIYQPTIVNEPYQRLPGNKSPVKRARDRNIMQTDDARISRSSFFEEIEKEQDVPVSPVGHAISTIDSNIHKAGPSAKRIGFNYLDPKSMK